MKSYPRSSEMGVVNPQQITRYSLSSIDYTGLLRIVYDRPKTSILPVGKTYEFPRVQENVDAAGDAGKVVMQNSPAHREALDELRDITEAQADHRGIADAMRDEFWRLEEEIAQHIE